jgi:hypothetical protein
MSTLAQAFAGVHWLWIIGASAFIFCANLLVRRSTIRKVGRSSRRALLLSAAVTLTIGAIWLAYLIRTHASTNAIELVCSFAIAYAAGDLIELTWKRPTPSPAQTA